MARRLGIGEVPIINQQDIIELFPPEFEVHFEGEIKYWVIPNTTVLVQLMKRTKGNNMAVIFNNREQAIPGPHQFESGSNKYADPVSIYMIKSLFVYGDNQYTTLFAAIGDKVAMRAVNDIAEASENIKLIIGGIEAKEQVKGVEVTKTLTTIDTPAPYGYNATELGLFQLINSPTESRETKIISTCLFLFPYIRDQIRTYITIIDHTENTGVPGTPDIGAFQPGVALIEGEQLGLLSLFVLGPAFSLDAKLNEQIARRVKAAAASMRLTTPTAQDMAGIINRVGWKAGDISPVIDDVLAAVICIKPDLTVDPEAELQQLVSGVELKQRGLISEVAMEILEQARLIYRNYHATSISFVPVVIPQIEQTLGAENPTFHQEINKFNGIKDTVNNCPYMGLRSKLPEKFHIKNFPKLVYCALKYHEASLTDPNDVASFKLYKVGEIKNHITSLIEQRVVEDAASQLPPPSIAALTQLVKTLPLELATNLMDKKTADVRRDVLMTLRGDPNKGAWATALIAREDGEAQRRMMREASILLTQMATKRVEEARDKGDIIMDPQQRRGYLGDVNHWKAGIFKQIEDLEPWEDSISEALSPSQTNIRNALVTRVRLIMDLFNQPPAIPMGDA